MNRLALFPSCLLLKLGWVLAVWLASANIAYGTETQPMRIPAGSHHLRPDGSGVARVPALCTRRDLPAPDPGVSLKVHSDTVRVVRTVDGADETASLAEAVDMGWIRTPTGDLKAEGSPSNTSIRVEVTDRGPGVSFRLEVPDDKPALFAADPATFDETFRIVTRYFPLPGRRESDRKLTVASKRDLGTDFSSKPYLDALDHAQTQEWKLFSRTSERDQIEHRQTVTVLSREGKPVLTADGLPDLDLSPILLDPPKEWLEVFRKGLLNVDATRLPDGVDSQFRRVALPQALARLETRVVKEIPEFAWTVSERSDSAARLERIGQGSPSRISISVDASSIERGGPVNARVAEVFRSQAALAGPGRVRVIYGRADRGLLDRWTQEVIERGTLGGSSVEGVQFIIGTCLHDANLIDRLVKSLLAKGAEGCVAPTRPLFGDALCLVADVLIEREPWGLLARGAIIEAEKETRRRLEVLLRFPIPGLAAQLFPTAYGVLLDEKTGEIDERAINRARQGVMEPRGSYGFSVDASPASNHRAA